MRIYSQNIGIVFRIEKRATQDEVRKGQLWKKSNEQIKKKENYQ